MIAMLFLILTSVNAGTVSREQLSDLHNIRAEIKTVVFERSRYQQDILKAELDIENHNKNLVQTQADVAQLRNNMIDRIATLYKIRRAHPQGHWLSMLNQTDFLRKSYYLKHLNAQDIKLITEFKNKTRLSNQLKEKIQAYQVRLQNLKKRNEIRLAELTMREKKQRELVKAILAAVRSYADSSNRDWQSTKQFFTEQRGKIEWPLSAGKMIGKLGLIREANSNLVTLKTGVIISSSLDTNVKSIFDGEVLHAESLEGWGPTVVIDHGESYYSVYSHLKNLSVRPGDRVIAKQKLAEVSAVTYHKEINEPSFYFELRHFSEPEDPHAWFMGEQP